MPTQLKHTDIRLRCDERPFLNALHSLEKLAERSPKLVQRFLDGLDTSSQLIRIDTDRSAEAGTSEIRMVFEPSDLLSEFLSASWTRFEHAMAALADGREINAKSAALPPKPAPPSPEKYSSNPPSIKRPIQVSKGGINGEPPLYIEANTGKIMTEAEALDVLQAPQRAAQERAAALADLSSALPFLFPLLQKALQAVLQPQIKAEKRPE